MPRKADIINAKHDKRDHYNFWKRRAGDVVTVKTAAERRLYMSALCRWIKGRAGSLQATSRAVDGGYQITFTGVSPAEANEARLRGSPPPPPGDDI